MSKHSDNSLQTIILGAGLAGLAAGFFLSESGRKVSVLEKGLSVGGLSKTISHNGFLFDLGGHRFLTDNKELERFVLDLLDGDVLNVHRKSKIFMRQRYFDYPLKPLNAVFGLGFETTFQIILDYTIQRWKNIFSKKEIISLEDWIVHRFGRKMFDLYFKDYSEKVWGIACDKISMEWVAQRIKGLSMGKAIKNAFFKFSGRDIPTLADHFFYPRFGIGEISERLKDNIEKSNLVLTDSPVKSLFHNNTKIVSVLTDDNGHQHEFQGSEFISSIPLTSLVYMLDPKVPDDIIKATNHLRFRDLVIVTIMLNIDKITDLTWMYLPEKEIPLGRIHEPKNWSPLMAPEGKTHIVAEYFCFEGDAVWSADDEALRDKTIDHLARLNFFSKDDVCDYCVLRKAKAYPIFDINYRKYHEKILDYLNKFENLQIVGRSGRFRYYNMDHALESGITAAENIIKKTKSQ